MKKSKERLQEYDFYYSAKQDELRVKLNKFAVWEEDKQGGVFIHGKQYTEMVKKGQKPFGNFDDHVLVYSGSDLNVTFN